jgi:threonine dehydratase
LSGAETRASVGRMITPAAIEAAARRLLPHIRRTPALHLAADDAPGGTAVTLKLEFLQHTGSFKARGAFNTLLTTPPPAAGVVAASGGNHGAAVAYAAQSLGAAAAIFVPQPTPAAKVTRIRSYGATVMQGGAAYNDALDACRAHQARTGAMDVHAYDQATVLEGQGTVGLELQQDAPSLTHVLVAVGGGGLIGGIAAWYGAGSTQVIGVEPAACPTLHAALAAGRPAPVEVGGIAADSLGARQAGALMTEIALRTGVASVLVTDEAIRAAQTWLWDRLRLIAEPGGATALAALLSGAWTPPPGARVGVVLCGANTDPGAVGY